MRTEYFSSKPPRILAHRGLTQGKFDENTERALRNALEHGAEYLEIDIRASSDGVAYVLHDVDLKRIAGLNRAVASMSATELDGLRLNHGAVPFRLSAALDLFPTAKFNIDVKSVDAIEPVRSCILASKAEDRILITSFSDRRRLSAKREMSVATGSGWRTTLLARLTYRVRPLLGFWLRNTDALQIPVRFGFMRLDIPGFIAAVSALGVEVHYWVINDVREAQRLIGLGAKGIVTDRADLILPALAE
jgi:glycerophosphoryl diester phosphodiesterase